jgi:hypothetical protein
MTTHPGVSSSDAILAHNAMAFWDSLAHRVSVDAENHHLAAAALAFDARRLPHGPWREAATALAASRAGVATAMRDMHARIAALQKVIAETDEVRI